MFRKADIEDNEGFILREKKGIGGCGVFIAVFAAICLGVFLFMPERLPPGLGLTPVPVEVSFRSALMGPGLVAMIENPTATTLHNLTFDCENKKKESKHSFGEEELKPGEVVEIGWMEGWYFEKDETLTISASGHHSKTWTVP